MIDYDYIEFSGVFHIPQNNIRYVIEEQKCFFLFDDICKGVNLDNNHSDFIKGLLAKFEDICVEEEINIEDSISYNRDLCSKHKKFEKMLNYRSSQNLLKSCLGNNLANQA